MTTTTPPMSPARRAKALQQELIESAARLSRAYVANIEAGRKRPSMKAVARIASALHVPQISIIAAPELDHAKAGAA